MSSAGVARALCVTASAATTAIRRTRRLVELVPIRHLPPVRSYPERDGFLTPIEPRGAIDYSREFNASSAADVSANGRAFVCVSVDGELLVTDGTIVESVHDDWVGGGPGENGTEGGDVVLPAPVQFQRVAAGARLVTD